MHDHDASVCLSSLLIGGLVGAAVALLTAPRSGRETRGLMGDKVREGAEYARDMAGRAAEHGQEALDQAAEYVRGQAGAAGGYVRSMVSGRR